MVQIYVQLPCGHNCLIITTVYSYNYIFLQATHPGKYGRHYLKVDMPSQLYITDRPGCKSMCSQTLHNIWQKNRADKQPCWFPASCLGTGGWETVRETAAKTADSWASWRRCVLEVSEESNVSDCPIISYIEKLCILVQGSQKWKDMIKRDHCDDYNNGFILRGWT